MNNTTVNYASSLSNLSSTASPAALKQIAGQNASAGAAIDTAPVHSVVKADQTSLSLASGLITKALSLSDVRSDKVAGLQKAIASGTYNVSSSDVAEKLVKSLLG